HDAAGRRVRDRGADLVHGQLGVPQADQANNAHLITLPAGCLRRGVTLAACCAVSAWPPVARCQPGRLWRRARRTMAAVPIAATVAPATVIVASLRAMRRPATACLPPRWPSSTSSASALPKRGRQPC